MAKKIKKVRTAAGSRSNGPAVVERVDYPLPKVDSAVPAPQAADRGSSARQPNRVVWGIAFGLVLLVALVFSRAAGFQFVSFDDPYTVYQNPHVNQGLTAEGIRWAFTDIQLYYWQPLTYLSHMLGCQIFGLKAGGHHVINLVIHAANALVLFFFLLRLTGSLWRSTSVATLFAVHPLAVESVAWITERNTLLAALCWLLTMWAYVEYVHKPTTRRYRLVLSAFVLAIMSKPVAVTLPVALLLLDWWPLGRFRRQSAVRLIREKMLLFAISLGAGLATVAGNSQHMITAGELPAQLRIAGAMVSYCRYLLKLFWPHPLGVFYQYSVPPVPTTTAALLALALLTIGAISIAKRFPFVLWGWLWYIIVMFPASGVLQVGGQGIADRFTYIPFIGLYVVIIWAAAEIVQRARIKPFAVVATGLLLTCALGVKSWIQTETWKDSLTLYSQDLKVTGGNEPMHRNIAIELVAQGRLDEAIEHYREAARLDPGRSGIHSALARLLASKGLVDEAAKAFSEELRYHPGSLQTLKELGFLYLRTAQMENAAAVFRRALRINPNDPEINGIEPLLAGIPEKAGNDPEPRASDISADTPSVGPDVAVKAPLLPLTVKWNIAMVLLCVALAFAIPKFGVPVFRVFERSWLRLSHKYVLSMVLVAVVPMAVRLAVLPIHPLPQPKVQDEFGYLLIADTFATGRITNPTPPAWEHFVTQYVFFQPTYTSKYPIGEPVFMAAAQIFGLAPWFGVWFAAGMMCAAVLWMLRGWLPPKWALLGALIVAVRFAITSYWMNTYWGGAVAALGGALVLGALPRIRRHARIRDSFVLAVGLLLVANTRPYEGFLLSVPVGLMLLIWLFRERTISVSERLRHVVLPLGAVLAAGLGFMLYYNWRVTGDPLLMPYKLNQKLYGTPTPFYFQAPLPEPPAVSRYKDLRDNYLWQRQQYLTRWPLKSFLNATGSKMGDLWNFFFQPVMTLPLLFLPLMWRRRDLRPLILTAVFVLAGIALYPFFFPHYAAPIFGIFVLIIVQGLRYVRAFEWRGRPVGLVLFGSLILLLVSTTTAELLSPFISQRKTVRSEALRQFEGVGGKHLIIVRYKPDHSFHLGWLYNSADIDNSEVIWARDLGEKSNQELIQRYSDRDVWLFETDERPARLSRYPGTETKTAGL